MSFQDVMREISEFPAAPLYTIGNTQGTVGKTLTVVFTVLGTWWLFRLRALVGVVYSSDMQQLKETLMAAATGLTWRSPKMDPIVIMRAFGSSSVDSEVSVWLEDPWAIGQYISQLNEAIWWSLKGAGIVIAFRRVDVHFDEPVVESLQGLRRAV
ncbi:MAG: hypothetical protein WBP34_05535 [Thermoanaerobaculia bacterium]